MRHRGQLVGAFKFGVDVGWGLAGAGGGEYTGMHDFLKVSKDCI